jgi:hypothetical protein
LGPPGRGTTPPANDPEAAQKTPIFQKISASAFDFSSHRDLVWNVGVMYGVRNLPFYARVGRSLFTDAGGAHTFVAIGLKVISEPMHGGS